MLTRRRGGRAISLTYNRPRSIRLAAEEGASPLKPAATVVDLEDRLESLITQYGAFIRRTIARFCPRDLGLQLDEIEQEARIRLWRALRDERDIDNPASYLYRIAASATIDAVRRVRARREIALTSAEEDEAEATPLLAMTPAPDLMTARSELLVAVRKALVLLATNRRRAVELHLQGFTSEEVAELLGWSEPKARNLTYRGLSDLRKALRSLGVVLADG